MTIQERVFSEDEQIHRVLCATLKQLVKSDHAQMRPFKTAIKERQRAGDARASGDLYSVKCRARARQLVYGFIRGKSREQMEPKTKNHWTTEGYYLTQAWGETKAGLAAANLPTTLPAVLKANGIG